jgi:hypothetical protein
VYILHICLDSHTRGYHMTPPCYLRLIEASKWSSDESGHDKFFDRRSVAIRIGVYGQTNSFRRTFFVL